MLPGFRSVDERRRIRSSGGADEVLAYPAAGAFDLPAHAHDPRAVWILKINREVIVDVAVLRLGAMLTSAHPGRFHRMPGHDPVGDIDVVHVLLDDVIAGEPREVQPVANLPFRFGPFGALLAAPQPSLVPEHLAADDLSNAAVMDAFDR